MTATDDDTQKVPTGRDAVDRLRPAGGFGRLVRADLVSARREMTGADGLLPALVKEALERGLAAWLERAPGLRQGRADLPGAQQRQERDHTQDGGLQGRALRDLWCPGTGPGPSPRARVASRASVVWTGWMRVNHQA